MVRIVKGMYRNSKPQVTRGICRQCKEQQPVDRREWSYWSPPKCVSCGGMLDRKGNWNGAKTTVSVTKDMGIAYPKEESEFEVHAWLWFQLRELGLDARGEVFAINGTARFDIVVFDASKRAVKIIEVKAKKHRKGRHREEFKFNKCAQVKQYSKYGLPVDCVVGMEAARQYVLRLKAEMNPGTEADEQQYGLVNHGAE